MSAIDPETYLRQLSERQLLDRESSRRRGHEDPVLAVAETLLAAGIIDRDAAERAIDDDGLARELRGDMFHVHRRGRARSRRRRTLEPRIAASLGQAIDLQDGTMTLHEILIGATRSTIRYTWLRGGTSRHRRGVVMRRHGGPHGPARWGSTPLAIVDAAGNRPTVSDGGGGGSDDHWEGELDLRGRVDPQTPWIEVDGIRLELHRATALLSVQIEPLEPQTPLERRLWRSLAVADSPFGQQADPGLGLEALASLGLLATDDPLARAVRAVAEAMPHHWRHGHLTARGSGSVRSLPDPWRSLLTRLGRTGAPDRTLLVGATTPPFDEVQVAVHSLTTDDGGFEALTEVTPDLFAGSPLGELPVAWWARDDRGNHYLGAPSNWSGGDGISQGTLRYWPALDRRARRLELLPTAADHRAVISISLADRPEPS